MNNIQEFIQKVPKAELHVHIEGTFEPEQMFEFVERNGIELKYKNVEELRKAYSFTCLQEFLDIYYTGALALKTERDFYELTYAYLQKASTQGVKHAEIFFDPQTHLMNNISFSVFFNGIYSALRDAKSSLGISASLIMCFLRHLDEEDAIKTLQLAMPYIEKCVGVGLDSSEKGNPPHKFSRVFEMARSLGLKTVAHAGEEGPAEYIYEAIEKLHISRIDHGNHAADDDALMNIIAEKKLPLTMCPLSNFKLGVIKQAQEYPVRKFLQKNIMVTLNSDDPAYFGGYINENYLYLQQAFNFSREEIALLAKNSFMASFIPEEEKSAYCRMIEELTAQG